jgi:hypothetical protein
MLDHVYSTISEWEEWSKSLDGVFPYDDCQLGDHGLLEAIEKDEGCYPIHKPETW